MAVLVIAATRPDHVVIKSANTTSDTNERSSMEGTYDPPPTKTDRRRTDAERHRQGDESLSVRLRGDVHASPRPSTYVLSMGDSRPELAVSQVRQQWAAVIARACSEHVPIYLARRGQRVAAIIDADDLDRLLALAEDMVDLREAAEARAEMQATDDTPIPWEQVKADLGLI